MYTRLLQYLLLLVRYADLQTLHVQFMQREIMQKSGLHEGLPTRQFKE